MPETELLDDPLLTNAPVHEGYKVLGGVVLYQKLGQGGMGAVYEGRHLRLRIVVAVKIMIPPSGAEDRDRRELERRFAREARTAALIDHPNLIRVFDVDEEAGLHFIVMQYIEGESAGDRLERKGKLSEAEAVEICLGAAEGLSAAHARGIVHRDVKPDNIMIEKGGRVRVADLGLVKASDPDTVSYEPGLTRPRAAMGTPRYMSPEQFESAGDVAPPADVWSLGVTLFQLLTGEVPWSASSLYALVAAVQRDPPRDIEELCPDVSEGVAAIVRKSLRKEPGGRYATGSEMAKALGKELSRLSVIMVKCRSCGKAYSARPSLAGKRVECSCGARLMIPDGGGRVGLADAEAGSSRRIEIPGDPPSDRAMKLIRQAMEGASPKAPDKPKGARPPRAPGIQGARRRRRSEAPAGGSTAGAILTFLIVLAAVGGGMWYLYGNRLGKTGLHRFSGESAEVPATAPASSADEVNAVEVRVVDDGRSGEAYRASEHGEDEAPPPAAPPVEDRIGELLQRASELEERGELADAVGLLNEALAMREDGTLRERLAGLELALGARKSLAEAEAHERAGRLDEAADMYERAARHARGDDRKRAKEALDRVRRALARKTAVEEVERLAGVKRWREVLDSAGALVRKGDPPPRVVELARRALRELAPPRALTGPLGVEVVMVDGGSFTMGSDRGKAVERPAHRVTVSTFYVGKYEITLSQFDAFRKGMRGPAGTGRLPAVSVSWAEAEALCRYLSSIDPQGAVWRLPTEAEWELAARGSEGREYPWGNKAPTSRRANAVGDRDGFAGLAPVGSFRDGATPLGIHDLAGNVAEWCSDWYVRYSEEPATDPKGSRHGKAKVVRGGSFALGSEYLRGAARAGRAPDDRGDFIGFRVVRELTAEEEKSHERARRGNE